MAQWLNFVYIKNHSFTSLLPGCYKACLKILQPLRICDKRIVQLKCGEISGQPLFRRNERLYHAFSRRKYSTYPGSFIRRKELLILIVAGKEPKFIRLLVES